MGNYSIYEMVKERIHSELAQSGGSSCVAAVSCEFLYIWEVKCLNSNKKYEDYFS